jgi:hypothetical protein
MQPPADTQAPSSSSLPPAFPPTLPPFFKSPYPAQSCSTMQDPHGQPPPSPYPSRTDALRMTPRGRRYYDCYYYCYYCYYYCYYYFVLQG